MCSQLNRSIQCTGDARDGTLVRMSLLDAIQALLAALPEPALCHAVAHMSPLVVTLLFEDDSRGLGEAKNLASTLLLCSIDVESVREALSWATIQQTIAASGASEQKAFMSLLDLIANVLSQPSPAEDWALTIAKGSIIKLLQMQDALLDVIVVQFWHKLLPRGLHWTRDSLRLPALDEQDPIEILRAWTTEPTDITQEMRLDAVLSYLGDCSPEDYRLVEDIPAKLNAMLKASNLSRTAEDLVLICLARLARHDRDKILSLVPRIALRSPQRYTVLKLLLEAAGGDDVASHRVWRDKSSPDSWSRMTSTVFSHFPQERGPARELLAVICRHAWGRSLVLESVPVMEKLLDRHGEHADVVGRYEICKTIFERALTSSEPASSRDKATLARIAAWLDAGTFGRAGTDDAFSVALQI